MKDVMGIIYTGENDARLRELTLIRAIAALPVAGRFRVIDFLVSSMVNGGMKNIGVIMQKNYQLAILLSVSQMPAAFLCTKEGYVVTAIEGVDFTDKSSLEKN